MKSKLFEVFIRGRSQSPMKLHTDKVATIVQAVRVILGPELGGRLRLETRLDSDAREWLVFMLDSSDQLDIFRTAAPGREQEEQEVVDALDVVHRKTGVLRNLIDRVSVVPSEFWDALRTHDIDKEVLDVWGMSGNLRDTGFQLVDAYGKGQMILFKNLPRILTRAQPVQVSFVVSKVAFIFAEGRALRFSEALEAPVRQDLKLVWPEGACTGMIAYRLLSTIEDRRPVMLIAHPAVNSRGQIVALELVRLMHESTVSRRGRFGLRDWRNGDWPMPGKTEQGASASPLFAQAEP